MSALARLGDTSDHLGSIISASPNVRCDGIQVARAGDLHNCPTHGITALIPITTKTRVNGQLVITVGAAAQCGAVIITGSPTTDVE